MCWSSVTLRVPGASAAPEHRLVLPDRKVPSAIQPMIIYFVLATNPPKLHMQSKPLKRYMIHSQISSSYLDFKLQLGVNCVHHFCPLHLPSTFVAQTHQLETKHRFNTFNVLETWNTNLCLFLKGTSGETQHLERNRCFQAGSHTMFSSPD